MYSLFLHGSEVVIDSFLASSQLLFYIGVALILSNPPEFIVAVCTDHINYARCLSPFFCPDEGVQDNLAINFDHADLGFF